MKNERQSPVHVVKHELLHALVVAVTLFVITALAAIFYATLLEIGLREKYSFYGAVALSLALIVTLRVWATISSNKKERGGS